MATKNTKSAKQNRPRRFAEARGSAAYVVEYQAFDVDLRSFVWKEIVRYRTRRLADMVVKINKRKCELRVRKLGPQNASDDRQLPAASRPKTKSDENSG